MQEAKPNGTDGRTVVGDVELRHVPEFSAVVLTARRPYASLPEATERLRAWSAGIDVLPTGATVCLFYDRPTDDHDAPRRMGVCMPTSMPEAEAARRVLLDSLGDLQTTGVLAEDEVLEVRDVPRILAAVAFYRGPATGARAAYERVESWIRDRPYLPAGAPREVHLATPGQLGDDMIEVEIQQPVIPKPR